MRLFTDKIHLAQRPKPNCQHTLEGREKMMEQLSPMLKDGFFHEGEITYHFTKPVETTED